LTATETRAEVLGCALLELDQVIDVAQRPGIDLPLLPEGARLKERVDGLQDARRPFP
jgi:hypothetical protein